MLYIHAVVNSSKIYLYEFLNSSKSVMTRLVDFFFLLDENRCDIGECKPKVSSDLLKLVLTAQDTTIGGIFLD